MKSWTDIKELVPEPGATGELVQWLEVFPVLEQAKTTPQDPYYHAEGDVWTHTKMVVDSLVCSDFYEDACLQQRQTLFLAALLHDVSKYRTTVIDEVTGKIGQPGHSRKGAVEARALMWELAVPFELREQVCRLISVHQVPFFALESNRAGKSPEFLVRELSWWVDIPSLAALAEADMRGRICADQQKVLDAIELFRELAKEEGCYGQPRAFVDDHTRVSYFRGASVHPDYPLFQEPGSKVTVMSGLPASGKNTWVEKHRPGLPVVSFDDAKEALGLQHGENDGKAAHFVVDRAKELLRAKVPFVWNATNINQQLRQKCLDLLYAYGAEVELVYLESPLETLFKRNSKRDTTLRNKDIVAMLQKWEVPLPTEAHRVVYLP